VCGYAGYRDWRLPNVKELQSIVDYEVFVHPLMPSSTTTRTVFNARDATGVVARPANAYWSATTTATIPDDAWYVNFIDGFVGNADKSNVRHVRAVRAGL